MNGFNSNPIINEIISNVNLKAYMVGFDLNDSGKKTYRLDKLIGILTDVIPEFAFGLHQGSLTENTKLVSKIKDAAKSIYKVNAFNEVCEIYLKNGFLDDDDERKYMRRGEFGELILHLLLRDFHNTIPLISKIYFKDSYGHAVHGFDAIHIDPVEKTLWLGESKIYINGKSGIKELINDINTHIKSDFLNDEFTIVSKRVTDDKSIPERDEWLRVMNNSTKLSDKLESIKIPLLCTYTSKNFSDYDDESLEDFKLAFEAEISELKTYFDNNNNHPLKDNLDIILLLFPIKCKKELVGGLHRNLTLLQNLTTV